MYRTATAHIYDVLDTVVINVVVTEYPDMPGTTPPHQFTYSTSIQSVGEPEPQVWAQRALSNMAAELSF